MDNPHKYVDNILNQLSKKIYCHLKGSSWDPAFLINNPVKIDFVEKHKERFLKIF